MTKVRKTKQEKEQDRIQKAREKFEIKPQMDPPREHREMMAAALLDPDLTRKFKGMIEKKALKTKQEKEQERIQEALEKFKVKTLIDPPKEHREMMDRILGTEEEPEMTLSTVRWPVKSNYHEPFIEYFDWLTYGQIPPIGMLNLFALEELMEFGNEITKHEPTYTIHFKLTRKGRLKVDKIIFSGGQILILNYAFKSSFAIQGMGIRYLFIDGYLTETVRD